MVGPAPKISKLQIADMSAFWGFGDLLDIRYFSAILFCVCTRMHLCTKFALRLWLRATLAIEAPGWAYS
jgi:hypothetical protein